MDRDLSRRASAGRYFYGRICQIMSAFLVTLLKGVTKAKAVTVLLSKLPVKLVVFSKAFAAKVSSPFFLLDELLTARFSKYATALAQQFVSKEPHVQKATEAMGHSLLAALWPEFLLVKVVLFLCITLLVIFIALPLFYKALLRRRLKVFISFNRAREHIAENLQKYLEAEGARVFRIPFQIEATHQNIVMGATKGIRSCDNFVCIPGDTQSYVEHEVLAATTAGKPVTFLVSNSGTLPNTADKRYPMFRLENTLGEQFKPLIKFLSYIGADFKSSWNLSKESLRHPLMTISANVAFSLLGTCLFSLWVYSFVNVALIGDNMAKEVSAFAEVKTAVVMAHAGLLVLLLSAAFCCFSFVSLFVVNIVCQFRARKKARLNTVAAQFNRSDWIGVIPDLTPGKDMYECLFDTAPSAHHELQSVAIQQVV
jgi:hypothetical protein